MKTTRRKWLGLLGAAIAGGFSAAKGECGPRHKPYVKADRPIPRFSEGQHLHSMLDQLNALVDAANEARRKTAYLNQLIEIATKAERDWLESTARPYGEHDELFGQCATKEDETRVALGH